jgi:hypothetical protein
MNSAPKHIDAVITWVDGNDEDHLRRKRKVLKMDNGRDDSEIPTGRDRTRFVNNGELKYCIRSIHKFAPWIRRIYLITDNQVPDFLTPKFMDHYRIQIVDHREILKSYEWAIPTFNSRTLETALWRIKGLADHFIYFNDDFVITQPVVKEDFFREGKVVLRGKWKKVRQYGKFRLKVNDMLSMIAKKMLGITRSMNLLLQIKSARLAGFYDSYFKVPHVPHPIRKQTLVNFFEEHPELFEQNIRYRFRSVEQFSGVYLPNHLEIKAGNAILEKSDDYVMINGELDLYPMLMKKLNRIENRHVRFVCLQGMEIFKKAHRKRIKKLLKNEIGLKKPLIKIPPVKEEEKEAVNQ